MRIDAIEVNNKSHQLHVFLGKTNRLKNKKLEKNKQSVLLKAVGVVMQSKDGETT